MGTRYRDAVGEVADPCRNSVHVWDRGTYESQDWQPNRTDFVLHGAKLQGSYELVRFKRAGERVWLIFKLPD